MDAPVYKKDGGISYGVPITALQKEAYEKIIVGLGEKTNSERISEFSKICEKAGIEFPNKLDPLSMCIYFGIVAGYLDDLRDISINTRNAVGRLACSKPFLIKLLERDMDPYWTLREIIYAMNHPAHREFFKLSSPLEIEWKFSRVYKRCQKGIQDFQENFRTEIELRHPNRIREYYFPRGIEVGTPQPYKDLSSNESE